MGHITIIYDGRSLYIRDLDFFLYRRLIYRPFQNVVKSQAVATQLCRRSLAEAHGSHDCEQSLHNQADLIDCTVPRTMASHLAMTVAMNGELRPVVPLKNATHGQTTLAPASPSVQRFQQTANNSVIISEADCYVCYPATPPLTQTYFTMPQKPRVC